MAHDGRNLNNDEWNEWEEAVRDWTSGIPYCENATFFRDGIICPKEYNNSNLRVLFIFKEVNDSKGCPCKEECHQNCIKNNIRMDFADGKPRTIEYNRCSKGIIGNDLLWTKVKKLNSIIEEAYKVKNNATDNYAVINLKKLGGGGKTNTNKSLKTLSFDAHTVKFAKRINEQIKNINPNIIVCCGTFDLFETVLWEQMISVTKNAELIQYKDEPKLYNFSFVSNKEFSGQILQINHPSCRMKTEDFLNSVKNILTKIDLTQNY